MSGHNGTVTEIDVIEGGFYGQILIGGVYIGWNDNSNGIALGIFHQASGGVAAYTSGGLVISSSGIQWGWNSCTNRYSNSGNWRRLGEHRWKLYRAGRPITTY